MTKIEEAVRGINGGVFANVDYTTPKHGLLKTSKVDGSVNPFWASKDDIRKVVTNSQINLGVVYENAINGRLVKRDVEPTFESGSNWFIEHENKHKNLVQNRTRTSTYIRYMPILNNSMTVRFMLDGNDITDQVKLYHKPHVETKTQTDAGLTGKDQIQWRVLEIEHIDEIRILGAAIRK